MCSLSHGRLRYTLDNSHLRGRSEMGMKQAFKPVFFMCMVFTVVFFFGFRPVQENPDEMREMTKLEEMRGNVNRSEEMSNMTKIQKVEVVNNTVQWNGINHLGGSSLMTIHTNQGRLGNQMFTFASLYGLGRLNHRSIALMPFNYEVLQKYFDVSIFPIVDQKNFVEVRPWEIGNWLRDDDKSIPQSSNIVKGNIYPTSYTFFDHVREEIREIFSFSDKIKNDAQEFLRQVKTVRPTTEVYVGIHVRRGDYLSHKAGGWLRAFDGREVDFEFFRRAVDYFRKKYENVTFLAVSDERDWCRQNLAQFGIMTTPDSPGPAEDLALLAECNHTIMTYGTYGFWGGYLAGGEVVYFTDFLKPNSSFARDYFRYEKMYPPDWVGISTTPPGFWENYTNPFLT